MIKEKRKIPTKVFTQLYDMNLDAIDQPGEYLPSIHQLEEQIEMLKGKIDDITERLDHVTSVIQQTHSNNVPTDLINFNSRLTLIENELAVLQPKSSTQVK